MISTNKKDPDSNELPIGTEKSKMVRSIFDSIAPRYDLLNRILTLGLDIRWRRQAIRELFPTPEGLAVDLACGTGDLCNELITAGYKVIGIDFSWGMLSSNTSNAPLLCGDISNIALANESVNAVTCGFALRNFSDLELFFKESSRILRTGGRLVVIEVDTPTNLFLKTGHAFYFKKIVPRIGALISDRIAYQYLPRSTLYLPGEEELLKLISESGFVDVTKKPLSGGIAQLLTATRS